MEFNWKTRSIKDWREFLTQSKNSNWMQTWSYAQAAFATDHLRTRIALIERQGQPIGMMCVQEIKVGPAEIVNLKRGPLWFISPNQDLIVEFAEKFRKEFPKKLFQRLRWMPEIDLEPDSIDRLEKIGFKLRKENFITSLIDLNISLEQIRAGLLQKWRNCLNKSQRSSLQIEVQTNNRFLKSFLKFYQFHQVQRKYRGPSQRFLQTEFENCEKTKDIFYVWAYIENFPVAAIAITCHGTTAAYRIGWGNPEGRKRNAHYSLLWKAIEYSKELGLKQFDLGGLLPDEAVGVTHFKKGLNGQEIKRVVFSN